MIKTIYFVFFICAFALGLWACTGKEQEKFKSLSTAHFEQLIKDNKIQLVDVRTVAEYSEGHIPGSLNINVMDENFAAAVVELLQKRPTGSRILQKRKKKPQGSKALGQKGIQSLQLG